MRTPRLRIFAGPNGSGKSTIKDQVAGINKKWLGVYINPDEIEKTIAANGYIDFGQFKIKTNQKEVFDSLHNSALLADKKLLPEVARLKFHKNTLSFADIALNSYYVSSIADFLHERLVASRTSFSFETVMSHPHKIKLLKSARKAGFRNYLYFIATEDPKLNISRVQIRVREGGHDVPQDKIVARYYRSLDNLLDAIRITDRAYMFDNTGSTASLVAEITEGKVVDLKISTLPNWFKKYVLEKGNSILTK